MSIINKFTIGFLNKERRKTLYLKNNSTLKVKENQEETQQKQALSQELVEILITFRFDIKQIMAAFKEHKFTNIDEACYFLMKDSETGKYHHRFIPGQKPGNSTFYQNFNNNFICIICKGDPTEHEDFDIESKKIDITEQDKNSKNFYKSKTSLSRKKFNFSNKINTIVNNQDDYNSNAKLKQQFKNDKKDNSDNNLNNVCNADLSDNVLANNPDRSIDKFFNHNNDDKNNNSNAFAANLNHFGKNTNINIVEQIDDFNNQNNNAKQFSEEEEIANKISNNNNSVKEKQMKIVNVKIDIPPETLNLFEDPDICRICFAEKMIGNKKAEFACGHKFCRKCVTNYLTNCIKEGKVSIFYL